jgi:transcription initiation factor IIE alpha subunit
MKRHKIIKLEEALRKREALLLKEYLWEQKYEKINEIIFRRMKRENRRHA